MRIPIEYDNLHPATKGVVTKLSAKGFSLSRYGREKTVRRTIGISDYTVADLIVECETEGIPFEEAVVESDYSYDYEGYGPPSLTFNCLESSQEAAKRAIESWKERHKEKLAAEERKEYEKKLLQELADKYPNEL